MHVFIYSYLCIKFRLLKSMVKAVFFDIDGTLVSFKTHEVPQSTIEALDMLRKKGIKVFIATGRHFSSINNLGDLQFDGYVTLNGGYCFAGDKVIYKHSIPDRDVEALIRYMETEESFPCAFVREKDIYMNYKDETVEEIFNMLNFPEPPIRPMNEIRGETVYQLVSFFTADQEKRSCRFCLIVNRPVGILYLQMLFLPGAASESGSIRCWNISGYR